MWLRAVTSDLFNRDDRCPSRAVFRSPTATKDPKRRALLADIVMMIFPQQLDSESDSCNMDEVLTFSKVESSTF